VRGQNFFNLDIGLPMDQLRSAIRSCLAGEANRSAFVVTATNRRGKPIECRVSGSPLADSNREARGVILMIDEELAAPPPSSVH
jgi:two-component system, chemotaxis family, CheB/CheR fusion protein